MKLLRKLGIKILIREVQYEGKRVVAVAVPGRASGHPVDVDGKYLMRSGESLVPMSQDELRRIFAEPQGHFLEQPVRSGLDTAAVLALLDTRVYFELAGVPVPATNEETLQRFASLDLVMRQPDQLWAITNMGALLFARDLAAFSDLLYRRLRIVTYRGTSKLNAVRDVFEARGYALSFADVVTRLMAQLPNNEEIATALRRDVPLYPEVALREFLANAMVHQDFDQHGVQLLIEIYDDRLEVSNPGRPLIDVTRFVDDEKSRNPALAELMRRMHICEYRGSGIDRVLAAIELHQMPAPTFTAGTDSTGVRMVARQRFQDMTPEERAWAAFLHCCLQYVSGTYMNNASLRQRFGLGENRASAVTAVFNTALDLKLIRRLDSSESRRFARYVPAFA